MKRKVMKLRDPKSGEMVCSVCGAIHWAQIRPGGRYFRGAWKCQNGCTLKKS